MAGFIFYIATGMLFHVWMSQGQKLTIELITDGAQVMEGDTIELYTQCLSCNVNESYLAWPFVNNSQWGSDQPLSISTNDTTFLIPIPYIGNASIFVAILKEPYFDTYWTVGEPLPTSNLILHSNTIMINVKTDDKLRNQKHRIIGAIQNITKVMYWEPWFTPNNAGNWQVSFCLFVDD